MSIAPATAISDDGPAITADDPGDERLKSKVVYTDALSPVVSPKHRLAHKVPLRMDVEMPTVEAIRKMVRNNAGVAFLPRMCVEQEIAQGV